MSDAMSTADPSGTERESWRPAQVAVMSAVCLVVGLLVGYLLRGSAPAPVAGSAVGMQQAQGMPAPEMGQQQMPTLDDMKRMAEKQAEPLLSRLKTDPNNADLLNKIGVTYKAAHQFKEAESYFQKALDIDPKRTATRTDLATCLYYGGDVDGAIAQLETALKYDPKHAGTLYNLGVIRWQGKNDAQGALAAWQQLLKYYPNFEQKALVEKLMQEVKRHPKLPSSQKG